MRRLLEALIVSVLVLVPALSFSGVLAASQTHFAATSTISPDGAFGPGDPGLL